MNAWYDIWDMLRQGAIVYGDEKLGVLVTFNGSLTFNIWVPDGRGHYDNTDVWTYGGYETPANWGLDRLAEYCAAHFAEEHKLDLARTDADEVEVGQRVKITETGETGTVISIEHVGISDDLMFYVDIDGREGEYTAEYFWFEDFELIDE